MAGTGRGAEMGILIRGGEALEKAGRIQVVVFDKTGTLTLGKTDVTAIVPLEGLAGSELLRLTASAEQRSEHPLAQAVAARAKADGLKLSEPESFEALPGRGLVARVDGHDLLIGNLALLEERTIATSAYAKHMAEQFAGEGKTPIYVASDGILHGVLAIADPPRPGSRDAIEALRQMGFETWMLSGDNQQTAEAVARQVGIQKVIAQVLPAQKVAVVKEAQASGRKVAMVGDGINDAPALAQADLGIAMGAGTDVALEASDLTLMRSDLRDVVVALQLARRTLKTIRQNLFLAFVYNSVAIPLASLNLLNPMIASAAMALSSVSVVTNSLRLRRFGRG
jgi:Cu+-exporting ATPase